MAKAKAGLLGIWTRLLPRDREELWLLLGALALLGAVLLVTTLAGEVLEGAAFDVTALGGPTVLGLTVFAVVGFLVLQGLYRNALFVFLASAGGWLLNDALKEFFARPRPTVVPHLRQVMSLSFPSGHALTSAAVFLTLGALLMRVAERRIVKFYCMFVAMLATLLVGATRVYLGVHYPTDVLAGWLIGLSWALFCWLLERALERRAGLTRERAQAQ